MDFYLGAHHPNWLAELDIPLFISRNRLQERKTFPRCRNRWALDSGAFTELSTHGKWTITSRQYAAMAQRFSDQIGNMRWAAPQDWMCEPFILKKTGLNIATHQSKTTVNYLALSEIAPRFPWIPVLQGFSRDDYMRHIDLYQVYRINLASLPLVGIGSVCRRQAMPEVTTILREIAAMGIRLHAFGFKMEGVHLAQDSIVSCDSMAWSFNARRLQRKWCQNGTHKNCANCSEYALAWRQRLLAGASMRHVPEIILADIAEASLLPPMPTGLLSPI